MLYVSLADAKAHCRVTHDEDDSDIVSKIEAASSMVKSYLKNVSPLEPQRDADDTPLYDSSEYGITDTTLDAVRYEVRAAVLILVQKLYDQDFVTEPGYLPTEVMSILYPLRDPTLA